MCKDEGDKTTGLTSSPNGVTSPSNFTSSMILLDPGWSRISSYQTGTLPPGHLAAVFSVMDNFCVSSVLCQLRVKLKQWNVGL